MNKLTRLVSILVAIILVSGVGFSAETPAVKETAKAPAKQGEKKSAPKQKSTKAKKPKVQKFVGNISAIDSKAGTVSVKGTDSEKNFVTQDAAKDTVERLSVGDRVRVQYIDKDGKLTTSSLRRIKLPQTKTKTGDEKSKTKTAKTPQESKDKSK